MSSETLEIISTYINDIVVAIVGLVCAFCVYSINKSTTQFKEKNDIELVNKYLDILEDLVVTSVETTNQTFVDEIKAMDKKNDNTHAVVIFDRQAQQDAFRKTKEAVLLNLNGRVQEVIEEFVGDFDSYLTNLIESKVHEAKKSVKDNG